MVGLRFLIPTLVVLANSVEIFGDTKIVWPLVIEFATRGYGCNVLIIKDLRRFLGRIWCFVGLPKRFFLISVEPRPLANADSRFFTVFGA